MYGSPHTHTHMYAYINTYLSSSNPVSRHVNDVINSSRDPIITIFVTPARVPSNVPVQTCDYMYIMYVCMYYVWYACISILVTAASVPNNVPICHVSIIMCMGAHTHAHPHIPDVCTHKHLYTRRVHTHIHTRRIHTRTHTHTQTHTDLFPDIS